MATDDKYDRQLRLWGPYGQRSLMEARICVLGSSAVATETLKNLVLPGIGRFTVVDTARVDSADLGCNFFVEEEDVGKPRAEVVCRWLQELNPDVQGSSLERDAKACIAEGAAFFKAFSMVVACQLQEQLAAQLGTVCEELNIPLLHVTSVGFVGKLRLFAAEHCVCETKPDSELGDLRITDPFPELRRFADSIDLASLDQLHHGHVPYVVLLIKALDAWRAENGGDKKQLPSTSKDKDRFREIIRGWRRSDTELNFDEALDNAYKAWVPYSIPDAVKDVLQLKARNPMSDFWIVARAVSQFVRDCGRLPLAGTLPDMASLTDWYVKLQEIYSSRAGGDCAAITAHIAGIQSELGVDGAVSAEYVQRFCRNTQYCEVFRNRSLEQELRPGEPGEGGLDLAEEASDEDSLVKWYLALRAAEKFRGDRGEWPGALCGDSEASMAGDVAEMVKFAAALVDSYKVEGVVADPRMLEELVRAGGCELHTTSSVLGGIAAQECVKLLTKQYAPLNNTLIYDGLHGKSQVLEM